MLASMAGLELNRNRLQRQPNHAASEDSRCFLLRLLINLERVEQVASEV